MIEQIVHKEVALQDLHRIDKRQILLQLVHREVAQTEIILNQELHVVLHQRSITQLQTDQAEIVLLVSQLLEQTEKHILLQIVETNLVITDLLIAVVAEIRPTTVLQTVVAGTRVTTVHRIVVAVTNLVITDLQAALVTLVTIAHQAVAATEVQATTEAQVAVVVVQAITDLLQAAADLQVQDLVHQEVAQVLQEVVVSNNE